MEKNIMLFTWFLKFTFFKPRDEYSIHDYIRDAFCPEFMSAEDFDEKEQILRDTPGPAGIKYSYYVGMAVNGIIGAIFALTAALIPVLLVAVTIFFIYNFMYSGNISYSVSDNAAKILNGMCATGLGLAAAHVYKMFYFNKAGRKSITVILISGVIFICLPIIMGTSVTTEEGIEKRIFDLTPFYISAIVVGGIIMGFLHNVLEKRRIKKENDPNRVIDPYSKKAKRERDRKLREEEDAMRKDRNILAELKKEINEKKNKK